MDQRGFTLIEAIVAMVIFAIIATGLAGMLASGVKEHAATREKTLAKQEALAQIELVRSYAYDSMGFVAGNPSGTIPAAYASRQISLATGGSSGVTTGTMVTQIAYVNDPTPTSYATSANYKRITVTVTRNKDGKQLIRSVTYVAPSKRAPYGGINNAIINTTVVDAYLNTPFENATVNLATGPSAPRSDVTGPTGVVTFPALLPNPTSGAQAYYDVTASFTGVLAGYEALPEDVPPSAGNHVQLAPGETRGTTIHVYKPATITVDVPNYTQGGTSSLYKVYVGSERQAEIFNYPDTGGSITITSLNGEDIIPGLAYTVGVLKEISPGPSRYYAPSTTFTVPAGYPSTLTQAYSVSLGPVVATRSVSVTVRTSSGSLVPGVRVDIKGGPAPGVFLTGKTGSGFTTKGKITFDVPQSTSGDATTYYTVTAWNSAGTDTGQTVNVNASSNVTPTVTVP